MDANTHLINQLSDFERLVDYASKVKSDYVILDVETDSEIERKARLFGIGICFNDKRAFYLQWRDQKGNETFTAEEQSKIVSWLFAICESKKLIGHNIIYDVLVLYFNLKIDLAPHIYSDTLLLKHTIEEEDPFSLKVLAVRDLGPWADKAQENLKKSVIANGGRWTEESKDMYLANTEILAEYCMWDVLLTYKLFVLYEKRLKEEQLEKLFYEEEVMPLYKEVTIPMKYRGFPVDVAYFKNLKAEIEETLLRIEEEIHEDIKNDIIPFTDSVLNKKAPIKTAGNFPKILANMLGIPLPVTTAGKVTLAAKALDKQKDICPEHVDFYDWLKGVKPLTVDPAIVKKAREELYITTINNALDEGDTPVRYVFNLNSSEHLAYYFFDLKKYVPLGVTKTGKKQVNAKFIDDIKAGDEQAQKIIDYKKLQKLVSTYVNGILNRQIDGTIYTSMLQFGTTSGRFSSRNPNLQNLPRVKEDDSGLSPTVLKYVNAIRRGFVASQNYKIVDADYSSLEPVCFAHMSGSEGLRDIFRTGKDLYSQIAIDVNKLNHLYSADKKADNFLKKHKPELRQLWKVPTLGIVYGMEEARLMQSIGCDRAQASAIIKGYLSTYPELKKYMQNCNWSAKKYGYVKTVFGRVRHLPQAKALFEKYGNELLDWRWAKARNLLEERYQFKNLLNNAKNFPIQGLAAHIINKSMIEIAREFKKRNLDAYIALMIHDQVVCIAREDIAEEVKNIMRDKMQNTVKISIPLVAEPEIADNLAESH